MGLSFYEAMDKYLAEIREDYRRWMYSDREVLEEHQQRMIDEFNERLTYKVGRNYAKVLARGSAHSFVVFHHGDKKFQCGDILKAASFSSPTRNFSRGSIFRDDKKVFWTGA